MRLRAMALAAILLLSACSTLRLTPPNLQVVNVSLVGGSVLKQDLRVRVRVDNPNDVELPVRGISCEVQLGGETFATGESERIRGDGDAERNRVYAEAFNKDPEFFGFYRSMQAYEAALQAGDTRMLLSPDSEFFRYFNNEGGQRPASAKPGEHPTTPAEPKPAQADTTSPEVDLSTISLDLGAAGEPTVNGGNGDPKWQEVATKLDLAKAYEEMGDKDGARELLNEVMREGDAAQQGQAQQLLAKLG